MKTLKNVVPFLFAFSFALLPLCTLAQDRNTGALEEDMIIVKKVGGYEEYSSTLDLNDNRKQLLMAGQNYQTNYGIYASIEISASSLGSNYRTLEKVSFEIVNYKPTYFIGIDSIVVAATKNKQNLTFKVYTRALSDKNSFTLNKNALKNIHFEQGSYMHSERYLNPMFPKTNSVGNILYDTDGRISCQPDNGKAFDFEFFYKDGRHVVRKKDYDKEEKPQTYMNEVSLKMPGKRCNASFNKVIF